MEQEQADLQVSTAGEREMLLGFLAAHRRMLRESILTLTDEQARRRLVPSLTTPLGLLKHAAFVETVWFICRFGGKTRTEAGIPENVDDSFLLTEEDTLASLAETHEAAVAAADVVIAGLDLEQTCEHPTMGPLSVRWVLHHCIRELAQHSGHADILIEQIRAERMPLPTLHAKENS